MRHGTGGPTTGVDVEVLLLVATPGGGLAYRVRRGPLADGTPDDAARRLALAAAAGPLEVLHSTSWRHESGRVVLTYAALGPVPADGDALTLDDPAVLSSGDPTAPTPPALHLHHVAAHAARHLALLAGTDPAVSAAAARSATPALWRAIVDAARDMPTGTHDEVHLAAGRRAAAPIG